MPRGIFSSMNRPITSPWSAVLTSSATITLMPSARSRASSAPETSLWSVMAIAPRPTSFAVVEQRVHRRRAVGRVVGVHVQVDVDEVALGEPLAHRRAAVGRGGARRSPRRAPRTRRPRAPTRARACAAAMRRCEAVDQRGIGDQPLELGGQRHRVARLEQQPQLALAQRLLVLRAGAPTTGTAPPASARSTQLRRGRGARRRGHGDRRPRQVLGLRAVGRARRGARGRAAGAAALMAGAAPGRAARSWPASRARRAAGAARAGTAAARRAPPRRRTRSPAGRRSGAGPLRAGRRRAGSRGSRPGRSARPGRGWRRSWPCARRGGRTAAPPAGAPPGWRRSARWGSGRCPR